MDPFRHDNGYYPPHQSNGYPQAPPYDYPPHQSYGYPQAPPLVVNYIHNYAMPLNYSHAMHAGYPNAMPPTLPGYPYNPTPGTYPIYQPWQNHWQHPEAHPGIPHGFVEPEQDWMNENDNSSHRHRDFDVVQVKRNVLPPPPKDLPAKPQHLAADVHRDGPVSLEDANVVRTPSPRTTAAPLEINNQKAAAPNELARVLESGKISSKDSGGSIAQTSVPSPKTPLISNNTLKQLSPISTSTKNVHVPKPRDDNLDFHVDTEESPNLAPFEIDQQYTGDTFRLLTAKTNPPPGRVLIGPDHRRSKPPIEASTQVIVAIIHFETQKHWIGIKITIYESRIAGLYFDSFKNNREGRAREVQSSYEEQLQTWFQQVGKEKQAKMDLTIMDSLNQNDGTSCGPYVWHFVECALKDEESTMKTIPPIELRKQQKALVLSTLQVSDDVKTPDIPKAENASKKSELHHDGIVPPVEPFHKQRQAPMMLDLEATEIDKISKSKNASRTPKLRHHQSDDAYAQVKSPSLAPVKRLRSSTRDQATTQSEISKSWALRSKDQQSHPAKRTISASFGTVETPKKPKPTTTKIKGSRKGRSGLKLSADDLKIASEARSEGKS